LYEKIIDEDIQEQFSKALDLALCKYELMRNEIVFKKLRNPRKRIRVIMAMLGIE